MATLKTTRRRAMLTLGCLLGAVSVFLLSMSVAAFVVPPDPSGRSLLLSPSPSDAYKLSPRIPPFEDWESRKIVYKNFTYSSKYWSDTPCKGDMLDLTSREDKANADLGVADWVLTSGGFSMVKRLPLGFETTRVACYDLENGHWLVAKPPARSVLQASTFALCINHDAWVLGIQVEPARARVYAWRGGPMLATGAALAPIALALCAPMLIRIRRTRRGRCPTCAYDLSGIDTETPCPECGQPR